MSDTLVGFFEDRIKDLEAEVDSLRKGLTQIASLDCQIPFHCNKALEDARCTICVARATLSKRPSSSLTSNS
jgi:hypothetical protein